MQSVLPKKRNLYKAHVNDPMLQQVDGRLTFVRNAFEEEEALEVVCCVCKKRFNVLKIDVRHCDYYWCSQDCFYLNMRMIAPK